MVQVLPYVPTFLEQISPHIANAAGGIGQAYGSFLRNKKDMSILGELQRAASAGEASPINMTTMWGQLSPAARKTYEPFLNSELRKQEQSHSQAVKTQAENLEKLQKSNSLISAAEEMRSLLPYTGSTMVPGKSFNAIPGGLNREGLEKRNEFDTLAASAASFFRDLETKGQLPQGLYDKVIEPRLPSSKLSERENEGRINGLIKLAKKYSGQEEKFASEERFQKVKSGTKLDEDMAKKIFAQAGNDKEKARKLAKDLGYEF